MKTKALARAVLLCASIFAPIAAASVRVTINSQPYQFDTNPRIAEVLAPVATQQAWYWPAAALYQLDSAEPEQLRLALLAQLEQLLQAETDQALLETLQGLKRQVVSWRLAKRIAKPIDFEAARLQPALNPRIDNGDYLLQLVTRPSVIYPIGAINSTTALTHLSAAPAASYITDIEPAGWADSNIVVLLQPDTRRQTVGVAAWNFQHIEAMPGAQLFVPLKSGLFNPQFEQLNQRILALAVHRVLP